MQANKGHQRGQQHKFPKSDFFKFIWDFLRVKNLILAYLEW
jgi:hypothetical protein